MLLWDALLTPQRRQSYFYGELAERHPAAVAENSTRKAGPASATPDVVIPAQTPEEQARTRQAGTCCCHKDCLHMMCMFQLQLGLL